jgi:predicted TIM-barrel fold metal-dependent hydrolase
VNLFQEFPDARFVLFHGGYPYADEVGLLAKAFPNVYLDLCWMPLISPSMTADVLERWLELVPFNKIMWGGDVWSVEECYGAVLVFKDVLAQTLERKMKKGVLNEKRALELAARIMHLNATELFGLEDRLSE